MPKYLLLKHYRGGPEPHRPVPPRGRARPAVGAGRAAPRPLPGRGAVRGHLHELSGDFRAAATAYEDAARRATVVAERDHLVRQAARARAARR